MRKICLNKGIFSLKTVFLFCIYGFYSIIAMTVIGKLFGINTFGFQELSLREVLSVSLGFYFYIYISSFNILALLTFLFISKDIVKFKFIKYLYTVVFALFCVYLLYVILIVILENSNSNQFYLWLLPQKPGIIGSEYFWGNIIMGSLLFYSWFLPLWYYKLGDWFWQRGKWAKNSMQ